MIKALNVRALEDALPRAGLNPSGLAKALGVSREAVSSWLSGEKIPKPDKLLRIGMLVGLTFEQMVVSSLPEAVPVVSFRRKAARKTKDVHLEHARETGELLKRLVKYLPDAPLAQPPVLKEPRADYSYVQRVAADIRKEMGLEHKAVVDFKDLIAKFNRLHAVIVPALWGAQEQHGNALNIYLPDSGVTWVFLNLDSNAVDFKFWMAHELGHSLAPALGGENGEAFADAFAQALLYPEEKASLLRASLAATANVGLRIRRIQEEAKAHIISPYTVRLAVQDYEKACGFEPLKLGDVGPFMGSVKTFCKGYHTITQALFKVVAPKPADYAACGKGAFGSSFFEALSAFCKAEEGSEHYIHQVLGLPLSDSKALAEVLRQ